MLLKTKMDRDAETPPRPEPQAQAEPEPKSGQPIPTVRESGWQRPTHQEIEAASATTSLRAAGRGDNEPHHTPHRHLRRPRFRLGQPDGAGEGGRPPAGHLFAVVVYPPEERLPGGAPHGLTGGRGAA